MARSKDKAGTWRISPKGGRFLLSGVTTDGERVKVFVGSRAAGETMAKSLFPGTVDYSENNRPALESSSSLDDWGYPVKLNESTVNPLNASLGVPPAPPPQAAPTPQAVATAKEASEKHKVNNNARAKSLMELIAVGWTTAVVWSGEKITDAADCERVKPNPKMGKELTQNTQETLVELLGDMEVKPWIMMVLLSLAIPTLMLIQARKLTPEEIAAKKKPPEVKPNLQSVP